MKKNDIADAMYARVFKGVLLDSDIASREDRGELIPSMDSQPADSPLGKYGEHFSPELRGRAQKMIYVYGLFYCFENTVRDLVAQRLEERKGPHWWNVVPENVRKRVDQKTKDAEKNKWHQTAIESDIDHTLFGDLAAIIVKEWQEFEDLFPGQMWVKQHLDELERSRNVIAHGNLLSDAEIERIEQYLDDWLLQVP